MACESTNGSTRMTWPFHVLEIVLSISLAMMSVRKLLQLVLWNLTIYQLLAINACVTKLGPRSVGYRLPWDKWWKNMKEVSIFCDTKHRPRLSWFTCCNATSATLQLHSETAQNWCPHKTRPPWLPGRHAKRVLPCYQFGTFQHSNRKVWLMLKFHIVLGSRMLDTYRKAKQSSLGLQKSLTAKCQSQFLVGLQLRSRRQSICNL